MKHVIGALVPGAGRRCARSIVVAATLVPSIVNAEYSEAERKSREEQLKHLSRIVDVSGVRSPARNELLGMLILRDEAPEKSARCHNATRNDSTREFLKHVLACPRCAGILELARGESRAPALRPSRPGPHVMSLMRRAEALAGDGFGYIPDAVQLGERLNAALDLVREVLRTAPDYPEALQLFGALKETAGDSVVAELAFKKAVNLDPTLSSALTNFALMQMRHDLHEQAHHVLRYALSQEQDYRAARLLAWLHRLGSQRPAGAGFPGGGRQELVSAPEAVRLMEWVVREERSPRKRVEDSRYLRFLRGSVVGPPWRRRPHVCIDGERF